MSATQTQMQTQTQVSSPEEPPRFWCHVCGVGVRTRVDEETEEVCCQQCGGNFVEEIEEDDPPQEFEVATEPSTPPVASNSISSSARPQVGTSSTPTNLYDEEAWDWDSPPSRASSNTQTEPRTSTADNGDAGLFGPYRSAVWREFGGTQPPTRVYRSVARGARVRGENASGTATGAARDGVAGTRDFLEPSNLPDLLQFLSAGSGRGTRIMSSNGSPVEFYISESGDSNEAGSLLNALGGVFPMLASNPGDYAFGNMATVINQLMQNDPNRHGAPPASKEVVEKLPKVKITQSDVDDSAECPVCKDFFAVDEDVLRLPCEHLLHPDCILPWLKQHNSCPVCRFELPTDDAEYESRRRSASSASS